MNDYNKALQESEIIKQLVRNVFNEIAKEKGLLCCKVATVSTVSGNSATVLFPGDDKNESATYPNQSNQNLSPGQKVYIYHKYGDVEQGWISVKS